MCTKCTTSQANNDEFSPCSRTMMDAVIAVRGQTVDPGISYNYGKIQHCLNIVYFVTGLKFKCDRVLFGSHCSTFWTKKFIPMP